MRMHELIGLKCELLIIAAEFVEFIVNVDLINVVDDCFNKDLIEYINKQNAYNILF